MIINKQYSFSYPLECPYPDCDKQEKEPQHRYKKILHRCLECGRQYEWIEMRWGYADTTPLLWPLLPDARYNTLTGSRLQDSSRFFWSEHGGGSGRASIAYSSLFGLDALHADSVSKCKYTWEKVPINAKNHVETEYIPNDVLVLPRLSSKDIRMLSTWRDRLFITLNEGNIFLYENAIGAARPNKPCVFELELNPRKVISNGMKVLFSPAIAENAVLQYGKENVGVSTDIALFWNFSGEIKHWLKINTGWQLWGPPLSISNEQETFFLILQIRQPVNGENKIEEILFQLYTVSGELVCSEQQQSSKYSNKSEISESNHFLTKLVAPPVFSWIHERLVLMIGGYILPSILTNHPMAIVTLKIPKNIKEIPENERWKAILDTKTVSHSTNDILFRDKNNKFADISVTKYPLFCLKGEQKFDHVIEVVFVHQLFAELGEISDMCILTAAVDIRHFSVTWTVLSTHSDTTVFTVASDGNFVACNTQDQSLLFSNQNTSGPIQKEPRVPKKETDYETPIFTPFGVLVRTKGALKLLNQGVGGYNLLYDIPDITNVVNQNQNQNQYYIPDIDSSRGIACSGEFIFVAGYDGVHKLQFKKANRP